MYRSHLKTTPFPKWNYATIRTPWILIFAPLTQFRRLPVTFYYFGVRFRLLFAFAIISDRLMCDSVDLMDAGWIWYASKIKEYASIRRSIGFGKNDAEIKENEIYGLSESRSNNFPPIDSHSFRIDVCRDIYGKCRTQIQYTNRRYRSIVHWQWRRKTMVMLV